MSKISNAAQAVADTAGPIVVQHAQLPLSCPRPDTVLWNSHPRVYLPIETSGEAKCPYCGALYVLED